MSTKNTRHQPLQLARPSWRRAWRRSGGALRRVLGERAFAALMEPFGVFRRTNVVMFHFGRSGSTVLGNMLGQHHQVYWDGEILSGHDREIGARRLPTKAPFRTRWRSSRFYPSQPLAFIKSRMALAGIRAYYGIEIKFFHLTHNQIALCDFVSEVQQLGFDRFIILERKNWLRKIVSSVIGHQQAHFHQKSNVVGSPTRIVIDTNRVCIDGDEKPLLAYFEDWQRQFRALRELLATSSHLELTYERDIQGDPLDGYRSCCDFLGVIPFRPEVRLGRTNPYPLREMIQNWSDVEIALSGGSFEWMLEESSVPAFAAERPGQV